MTSHDSIDDLLVLSRRGALSESEQRRLREALASEPETRLLYDAGRAFDDEAPIEAGDDARVERLARAVERTRRPLRRMPRWPVVRAALAGALAASLVFAAVERLQKRATVAPQPTAPAAAASTPDVRPRSHAPTSPLPSATTEPIVPAEIPSAAAANPSLPSAALPTAPRVAHAVAEQPAAAPLAAPSAPAVAGFPDAQSDPDQTVSSSSLFSAANRARANGDLARAVTLYRKLEATFPASGEAVASRVTLGMIELQQGNPSAALDSFQAYLAHGGGSTRAEALWGEAQALRRLGRSSEERATLSELAASYPSSAYAGAAAKRLTELR